MIHVDDFRQRVVEVALDAEGLHHEFVSGGHGRKLDFDSIETGSALYSEWVDQNVDALQQLGRAVVAVVGVANGTNRLALDVGRAIGAESLFTSSIFPNRFKN